MRCLRIGAYTAAVMLCMHLCDSRYAYVTKLNAADVSTINADRGAKFISALVVESLFALPWQEGIHGTFYLATEIFCDEDEYDGLAV